MIACRPRVRDGSETPFALPKMTKERKGLDMASAGLFSFSLTA